MSSKLLYEKVRSILLYEWDPIGVGELPEAQDEYDSYVHPVCDLINSGKDAADIYNYLSWVTHDYMCLDGSDDINRIAAEKLAKLSITH